MTLDIKSIVEHPLRLIVFLLLLVVRGLPSLLVYRRALPMRQRLEMTLVAATTMPLLIALAEIGLNDGVMIPANAAALVGAGVLSVLIFPSIAGTLARRDRPLPGTPEAVMDAVVVTEARVVGEVSLEGDTPLPDEGEPAEGEPAEPEKSAD
jgi:Kef-type K+ transport system membrane component KefB